MTLPLLPVAWTLCYEALFYVAATFVLADRRWLYPVLGLFVAAMATPAAWRRVPVSGQSADP